MLRAVLLAAVHPECLCAASLSPPAGATSPARLSVQPGEPELPPPLFQDEPDEGVCGFLLQVWSALAIPLETQGGWNRPPAPRITPCCTFERQAGTAGNAFHEAESWQSRTSQIGLGSVEFLHNLFLLPPEALKLLTLALWFVICCFHRCYAVTGR